MWNPKSFARVAILLASCFAAACSSDVGTEPELANQADPLRANRHFKNRNQDCRPGPQCLHGKCCPQGLVHCDGACVDLETSSLNCGGCGNVCDPGYSCSAGVCCATGQLNCGAGCVDVMTSALDCGACGRACGTGEACSKGLCCPAGQTNCGGTCANVDSDALNCGACGVACPGGMSCSAGLCCGAGLTNCGGALCVDLANSAANCGGCGHACAPGFSCSGGTCCAAGQLNCGAGCVDVLASSLDCGACGHACGTGQACFDGLCCDSGQANCAGICTNIGSDPLNCGACGVACPAGATCTSWLCCGAGLTNCGGVCADLATSVAHCGSCDNACAPDLNCAQGQCLAVGAKLSPSEISFTFPSLTPPSANSFYITNTGTQPTGPLSVTNSDAVDFEVLATSTCLDATLAPGQGCSLSVRFNPPIAGSHTAEIVVIGAPGGTVVLHLAGRYVLFDGQTGCTNGLDCPADCAPCPAGTSCPPCQGSTCLSAFYDLDGDGYGSSPTTVCNRILPWANPKLSFVSGDCDDDDPALYPGTAVCSKTDPAARVVCHDDGSSESQACAEGGCFQGRCGPPLCPDGTCCPAGQTNCGGTCFDLLTTDAHCGACETSCPAEQACVGGQCTGQFAKLGAPGSWFFDRISIGKTFIYVSNSGNLPTGPVTVTNSNPDYFSAVFYYNCDAACPPGQVCPPHSIPPRFNCPLAVYFTGLINRYTPPGIYASDLTISGDPGGTVTIHLVGRVMLLDGWVGCTNDLDCIPAQGCPACTPVGEGYSCPPCLTPGKCLTAFYDFDYDGYGSPAGQYPIPGKTTVCNRIVWPPVFTDIVHDPFGPLSFAFDDCDDSNRALFPGASICSATDPNARLTCLDNGSISTETCTTGACANGQCGGTSGP